MLLCIDSGSKWQASKSSTHSMMMWSLTIPFTRRSRVDVTYGGPKFLVPPQILWMSQFSFFFLLAETSVFRRKRQKLKYWKKRSRLVSTFNQILTIPTKSKVILPWESFSLRKNLFLCIQFRVGHNSHVFCNQSRQGLLPCYPKMQ